MADPNIVDFDQQYADQPPPPAPPGPAVAASPNSPPPQVGLGEDFARSILPSLSRGTTGFIGLPGTAGDLISKGFDYPVNAVRGAMGYDPLPPLKSNFSGAALQGDVEKITGPQYTAQRTPNQYASSLIEAAPSAVIGGGATIPAKIANWAMPALSSEFAGQLAKGSPNEWWIRGLGGLFGGFLGAKAITPSALPSAEHQAAVRVMQQEGIPLWASDKTGSRFMKVMESSAADMPWSAGPAQKFQQAQNTAYNQAMTAKAFDQGALESSSSKLGPLPAGAALPNRNVMQKGAETLSDDYNRILGNTTVQSNPALQRSLLGHQTTFENTGIPQQADINALAGTRNAIVDKLIQGQGSIPGTQYQAIRSRLSDLEAGARNLDRPNSALADAYKGMKTTLDDAAKASLSPADAKALDLTNQRYAVMKQLEPVVANTKGENLVPSQVASGMAAGRVTPAARGLGTADDLANAAALIMKPLPNSLTAVRTGLQQLFGVPGALAAGAAAHYAGNPLLAGAMAAPHIVGRAVVTEPVQQWLANTALPQRGSDLVKNALMQQGVSQPTSVWPRVDNAQRVDEAQRMQNLRDQGLLPSNTPDEPFVLPSR